jgi:hypothetical protein
VAGQNLLNGKGWNGNRWAIGAGHDRCKSFRPMMRSSVRTDSWWHLPDRLARSHIPPKVLAAAVGPPLGGGLGRVETLGGPAQPATGQPRRKRPDAPAPLVGEEALAQDLRTSD